MIRLFWLPVSVELYSASSCLSVCTQSRSPPPSLADLQQVRNGLVWDRKPAGPEVPSLGPALWRNRTGWVGQLRYDVHFPLITTDRVLMIMKWSLCEHSPVPVQYRWVSCSCFWWIQSEWVPLPVKGSSLNWNNVTIIDHFMFFPPLFFHGISSSSWTSQNQSSILGIKLGERQWTSWDTWTGETGSGIRVKLNPSELKKKTKKTKKQQEALNDCWGR